MKTIYIILVSLVLAATSALALAVAAQAQTTYIAATPAVGYSELTARGASDSFVSIPLVQRSALIARISAVASSTVTLSATGVADGTYAPGSSAVYYLQFVSGKLAGLSYEILNNQTGVFTLDTRGDDLTNHPLGTVNTGTSGDLVRIRPFWTVGAVFGTDPTQILLDPVASLNSSVYSGADAILLPDNVSVGTEKPSAKVIAYVTGSGWRERSAASTDASATVLWPGVPFTIRRQNPASVNILVVGYVSPDPFVQGLPAMDDGADMDFAASLAFPLSTALSASGLSSGNLPVIMPSIGDLQLGDLVLDYPADREGFSLPPDKRFYVLITDWFETEAPADQYVLQPEVGYVLRFRGLHAARYWTQSPPP
jgi:uncharacterized protein (TIGR02597 family)